MNNFDELNIQQYKIIRCKDSTYKFKPYELLELTSDRYEVIWDGECSLDEAKSKLYDAVVKSKEIMKATGKWHGVALVDNKNTIIFWEN